MFNSLNSEYTCTRYALNMICVHGHTGAKHNFCAYNFSSLNMATSTKFAPIVNHAVLLSRSPTVETFWIDNMPTNKECNFQNGS